MFLGGFLVLAFIPKSVNIKSESSGSRS
jgi:hypothetical protein